VNSIALAEFYDREEIIGKVQAVHELEAVDRYSHLGAGSGDYWNRILTALTSIPERYHAAALAVFANVVYVGKDILDETMRFLAQSVAERCERNGWHVPSDIHVFSTDDHGLAEDLYSSGDWPGRLEDLPFRKIRTVSQLLDVLEALPSATDDSVEIVRLLLEKPLWILLADNALSGGSVTSDFKRLAELRAMLFPSQAGPSIGVLAQIATAEARSLLRSAFQPTGHWLETGLLFDRSFKVNDPACRLFAEKDTRAEVAKLSEWFSAAFFPFFFDTSLSEDKAMKKTLDIHLADGGDRQFTYGWKDCGYTLVTPRNCPTNSIPLLWYPMPVSEWSGGAPPINYVPPFPRVPSRVEQRRLGDSARLQRVAQSLPEIRSRLVR
jgi:hypothetical protein